MKTKYFKKILFLSVSHLITLFLQSLKVGSPSALMFAIITQSDLLLIRYLSHPIQLILMEKIQTLQETLIVGTKLNISSVICHLKHSARPKLKVYFLKNALENINEEVKKGNFN